MTQLTGEQVKRVKFGLMRAGLNPRLRLDGIIDDECHKARVMLDAMFDVMTKLNRGYVVTALQDVGILANTPEILRDKVSILKALDAFLHTAVVAQPAARPDLRR